MDITLKFTHFQSICVLPYYFPY